MGICKYIQSNPELLDFLKEIPREELDHIMINKYNEGDLIIKKGNYPDRVIIVIKGICNVLKNTHSGNLYNSYQIKGIDIIGMSEILSNDKRYIASVQAQTESIVGIIDRQVFLSWINKYGKFSANIILKITTRLHKAIDLFMEFTNSNASYSVITLLIDLYESYKDQNQPSCTLVKLKENRQEIAEKIGVNIRTVNRVIKELRYQELITVEKGKIHIYHNQYKALKDIRYNFPV